MDKLHGPYLIPVKVKGGEVGGYALVDGEDYADLSLYSWRFRQKTGRTLYAERTTTIKGKHITIPMHRHILCLKQNDGIEADHRNGNGLDNRRLNLRTATRTENAQNFPAVGGSSQYRGVSWDKAKGKWVAQVSHKRKHIYLGAYENELDAALAAAAWRKDHFAFSVEPLLEGVTA